MEGAFEHKGLSEREFNIHLDGTRQATVVIRDGEGNIVSEINVGVENSKGGDVKVKWDGTHKDTGNKCLSGTYTVDVMDSSTGATKVGYAYQEGTVSGVSFSSSGAGITINDKVYGLGYLVSVEGNEAGSAASGGSSGSGYLSEDTVRKIAGIMDAKDSPAAIEKIASILGVDEEDRMVSEIVGILNRDISEEDMIKKLAETLGQKDADYADMLNRVRKALG
jgi:hypothetical protein